MIVVEDFTQQLGEERVDCDLDHPDDTGHGEACQKLDEYAELEIALFLKERLVRFGVAGIRVNIVAV